VIVCKKVTKTQQISPSVNNILLFKLVEMTEIKILNLTRSDFKYLTDFRKSVGLRWIQIRNVSHA